jgi:hypothetical protein
MIRTTRTTRFSCTVTMLGTTLGLTLAAAPAHALNETHAYGVASFGGTGQCGTSDLSHSVHTSTAASFSWVFNVMKAGSLWDQVSTLNNTSARGSYFTDSTKGGSCGCSADDMAAGAGADEGDIFYIHTHGNHNSNSSGLLMGNSSYDCEARTNQNMFFGNPSGSGDLDIAVVKACQSGDYGVWKAGGYRQQMVSSDSSFSVWNAFHGDSSCGSHVTSYVKFYSLFSILDGVGENWIDAAYDDDSGADSDDCPVSIVFGSSSGVRHNMFEYGGWADRKNTGTKSGSTYFFINGCDPDSGVMLPN